MNTLTQKATLAASPLLVLFSFALPLSTSAASILAILLLLAWILSGNMKEKFSEILHNPVTIAVLLYIVLHIIGLLWSEDLTWGLKILKKQWKLLLFPVFLTLVKREHTRYYMTAFVAAIFLKACKAYLVWLGFVTLPVGSVFTTVGTSHVIYNPMLALACYIILQDLLFGKNSPIVLHIIGLLWSEDLTWGLKILKKQWKLLLFPVFLTLGKREHTRYYMTAFVAAIFLKACKAYLVWLGFITLPVGSVFTTVGTSHVIYNPMLALACYIILQDLLFGKNSPIVQWSQTFLFLFLSCNMFITVGRTGQAVFFVLLAVALIQFFYTRSKKMLLAGLILLPLLLPATYQISSTFRERVDTAATEMQNFSSDKITSMGCRVWYCKNTLVLVQNNWLTGTGTGDFPGEYAKINKIYSPSMPYTDNPHNQYLLTLSQFGIIGLISLAAIFLSQLVLAFRKKDHLSPLRQAFPIFFLVIMLGESYLQVYGTGFLFSLFSAILYKESN